MSKVIIVRDDLRADILYEGGYGLQPWISKNSKLHNSDILEQFGLKPSGPIPPDFSDEKWLGNTLVTITKKIHPKGARKRVFANCRNCGRKVCAGHYDQHLKTCDAKVMVADICRSFELATEQGNVTIEGRRVK